MLGLFGSLNMGARSLQTQQQGIETSGHNLANVNNPAYARQRINIVTGLTIPSSVGPIGTGAEVARIQQIRDGVIDAQIQTETSITGYLDAQYGALQNGQAILGQEIDRQASGPEGTAAALGSGGQHGIADYLSDLFSAFQSLSTQPTSLSARQDVLSKAQNLAARFNQIDARLNDLNDSLDAALQTDVTTANDLLASIADLNRDIIAAESGNPGSANDLRDLRQSKIEDLAKLVNIQTTAQTNGGIDISVSGVTLVSGVKLVDTLQTYDPGSGHLLVQTATGATPLTLTSGSMQGYIDARDVTLQGLRDSLNTLANQLITQINTAHQNGFGLTGTTGADFFIGSGASDIQVNSTLLGDPNLLQASGTAGTVGDNTIALILAQLADQKQTGLNNQTFSQNFAQTVSNFGQRIASVNSDISDQNIVQNMLLRQRDSVSGVSLDEEMTDMMKFQKAYQASAKFISTLDQMLDTILNIR